MLDWLQIPADNPLVVGLVILSALMGVVSFVIPQSTKRLTQIGALVVLLTAFCWVAKQEPFKPLPPEPHKIVMDLVSERFDEGFRLAGAGQCTGAMRRYEEVVKSAPEFPTVHAQKAYCLRQLGRLPEALLEAQKALQEITAAGGRQGAFRMGHVEYMLATIQFVSGDPTSAKEALEKAVSFGFPYGCDMRQDGDFQAMEADSRFHTLTAWINEQGSKQCFGD